MATVLIHHGVAAGALGAILSGRYVKDATAALYAGEATLAKLIADAVASQCATVTLADADLATPSMEDLCAAVTSAVLSGRDVLSGASATPVAGDFTAIGLSIAAAIKAGIAAIAP